MKYILKPSLEHIALVKILVTLWNQDDVGVLMANLRPLQSQVYNRDEELQKMEDRVIEKVSQLLLPKLLKEKLLGLIKPIGLEILKWMQIITKGFHLHVKLPVELCWNSQGTIDRKRTAEMLCKNENLDISKRFRLACFYCLEDSIPELWKKMPEYLRESVLDENPHIGTGFRNLISYWTCAIKQEVCDNELFSYQYMFKYLATTGNKAGTEYFLQKLTPREREECLVRTSKCVSDAGTLCFLFLQMNEEQQTELFKSKLCILCFLDWPFQIFFMETANMIWEFLDRWNYVALLKRLVKKINCGYKDWNYKRLFVEVLQKSPNAYFITDEFSNQYLLSVLSEIKDEQIASLFIKNANPALKKKLMGSISVRHIYLYFLWGNNLNLLEIFIQEFLPSKEEIIKFKEKLETNKNTYCYEDYLIEIKPKLDKLIHLYHDSACKYNKRSIEESESCSSKRTRSPQ